ncbi:MAG: hypothetical protein KR126chlam4_00079 [Candidatus Anoxychlamydiales bacterium]|nr:hypothetical protein [Candidatus Anoxychlamydiales bacterium]NGX40262.1 hypothetical protein [Candidatus Anoxychlamydiales bacterium]
MTARIISPPIRIITNPSQDLLDKIQKAGVTLPQLESYMNRSLSKPFGGRNNNKSENAKKAKKYKKLSAETWKDIFNENTSTYVHYI